MGIRRDRVSIEQNTAYSIVAENNSNYKATIEENFKSVNDRINKKQSISNIDKNIVKDIESFMSKLRQEYENVYDTIENR